MWQCKSYASLLMRSYVFCVNFDVLYVCMYVCMYVIFTSFNRVLCHLQHAAYLHKLLVTNFNSGQMPTFSLVV